MLFGAYTQNNAEISGLAPNENLRIEFRLDGPITRRRGTSRERHFFTLNFLLTCRLNNDVYVMDDLLDGMRKTLKRAFCIFKIDDENVVPPFTLVGPFKIASGSKNPKVHNFGIIRSDLQLVQGVVSAQGYLDLPVEE